MYSQPETLFVVSAGDAIPGSSSSEDVECSVPAGLGNDLSNVITVGGLAADGMSRSVESPTGSAC